MKNLLIVLFTFCSSLLTAQITNTWVGGTPGKVNHWNEARNWSKNCVPDEFTIVIIEKLNTGHSAQPTIDKEVEIARIEIHNNAILIIEQNGVLRINNQNPSAQGIQTYGGQLINFGEIVLINIGGNLEINTYATNSNLVVD